MTRETLPLWHRLSTFQLDAPGIALYFLESPAHEQDWSLPYTTRVIYEYRILPHHSPVRRNCFGKLREDYRVKGFW